MRAGGGAVAPPGRVWAVLVTDDVNRSVDHLRTHIGRGVARRERRSGVLGWERNEKPARPAARSAAAAPMMRVCFLPICKASEVGVSAHSARHRVISGQPQAKTWQSKSPS